VSGSDHRHMPLIRGQVLQSHNYR